MDRCFCVVQEIDSSHAKAQLEAADGALMCGVTSVISLAQ